MKKKWKTDYLQIILVSISLILIIYSSLYICLYYDYNDILRHFPKNYSTEYKKLSPNEIGDSIGGTLNPIIGITASIITFLAFYIQYKSNKQQVFLFKKQLKYERKKENYKIEERHRITLKVFTSLISQMLYYYEETGRKLNEFIDKEKNKPLSPNQFMFLTDASYVYFKELSFTEIYEAMIWYFNSQTKNSENWEEEFTKTLNKIDFYDKIILELKEKYLNHVKSKSKKLNEVGLKLDEKMGAILSDDSFSNDSESKINGLDDYMRIAFNQDKHGNIISENFEGTDYMDLQSIFFKKFLNRLLEQLQFLEYLDQKNKGIMSIKNPEINRIKSILDYFSVLNKTIGNEERQTYYYVNNLELIFNSYFSENSQQLKSISNFISRINL